MGKIKVIFPSVLTDVTKGQKTVEVSASTLNEAINRLVDLYGDPFKGKIFDSTGRLKRFLSFYVNGKNILHLKGLETPLNDNDEVSLLIAIAGG